MDFAPGFTILITLPIFLQTNGLYIASSIGTWGCCLYLFTLSSHREMSCPVWYHPSAQQTWMCAHCPHPYPSLRETCGSGYFCCFLLFSGPLTFLCAVSSLFVVVKCASEFNFKRKRSCTVRGEMFWVFFFPRVCKDEAIFDGRVIDLSESGSIALYWFQIKNVSPFCRALLRAVARERVSSY